MNEQDFDQQNEAEYQKAVKAVRDSDRASISLVQRTLRTNYARAAALIIRMEDEGFVSRPQTNGARRVLPAGRVS